MKRIICLAIAVIMMIPLFGAPATSSAADPSANYAVQRAPHEDSDIRMWFQHANVKVHQEDTASTGRNTYSVYMAKNEYQGTQVTLYSPSVTKQNISANVTAFTAMNGSGASMSADVYYEYYVKCENLDTTNVYGVSSASASFIRNGMIPDAMAKVSEINRRTGKFTLTAGKTETLYIKIKSETDTPSGWYSGQFNVTDSSGNVIKTATVYACVWSFAIPEETHLQTAFNLSSYGVGAPFYKSCYDYLLDNRMCGFCIPGDLNSDNAYLTNPRVSAVSVADKTYLCQYNADEINDIYEDLSTMDDWDTVKEKLYFYTADEPISKAQYDALYAAYGIKYTTLDDVRRNCARISAGWPDANRYTLVAFHENHPYPAGYDTLAAWTGSGYLTSDDHSGRFDQYNDAMQAMINENLCSLWCVQTNFFTPQSVLNSAGYRGDVSVSKVRSMNGIISGFDLFGAGGNYFNWDTKYNADFKTRLLNYRAAAAADGKNIKLWTYVCGNGASYTYCNHLIENTGLQSELLMWQQMQVGSTGYLYYGTDLWDEYAATCGAEGSSVAYDGSAVAGKWRVNRYEYNRNGGTWNVYGNGVLFYGTDMKSYLKCGDATTPLGTVRVEHIRDGIEDYEMLYMYRELYGEAAMQNVISQVSSNVACYVSMPGFNRSSYPSTMTSEDIFASVRVALGAAVDSGYHTHEWNAGVVTVAPTYTETGIRTYTCIGCGMTCTEEIPVLDPLPGDVNGDGKTNSKDLSMMKRIISGAVSEGFVIANTDVDGNGRYNSRDLASIKRIVAGA